MPNNPREERRAQLIRDYHETFDTPAGKRVLEDLITAGHVLHPVLSKSLDPHETAFRDGERNIVLLILNRLAWSTSDIARITRQEVADEDPRSPTTDVQVSGS